MIGIDQYLDELIVGEEVNKVDYSDCIMDQLNEKRSRHNITRKGLIFLVAIFLLMLTTIYASTGITFNKDGSVSFFSDDNNEWRILDAFTIPEVKVNEIEAYRKMWKFLDAQKDCDNEIVFGYYKYNKDSAPIFVTNNTKSYSDDEDVFLEDTKDIPYVRLFLDQLSEERVMKGNQISIEPISGYIVNQRSWELKEETVESAMEPGEMIWDKVRVDAEVVDLSMSYKVPLTDGTLSEIISLKVGVSKGVSGSLSGSEHPSYEIKSLEDGTLALVESVEDNYLQISAMFGKSMVIFNVPKTVYDRDEAIEVVQKIGESIIENGDSYSIFFE